MNTDERFNTRMLQMFFGMFAVTLAGLYSLGNIEGDPATAADRKPPKSTSWKKLDPDVKRIIEDCGTERAFSGKWLKHKATGTYTCARCGSPLFDSDTKFDSRSGWPSFDGHLPGSVAELPDPDGMRVEIRCKRCDGHLGHVFRGEGMTPANTRHCVNSLAMDFSPEPLEEAFFAGGCFWGVEHLLETVPGVVDVVSGYMGGYKDSPTYKEVLSRDTGHAETVRVRFNPSKVSYETLAKRFFEIHDPTQVNRQGPDRGEQYRSAVFFTGKEQRRVIRKLAAMLEKKGFAVATQLVEAEVFWPAEEYHQDYYVRTGKAPYCHSYTPRF